MGPPHDPPPGDRDAWRGLLVTVGGLFALALLLGLAVQLAARLLGR